MRMGFSVLHGNHRAGSFRKGGFKEKLPSSVATDKWIVHIRN
jgi:hypothetical protein